MSDKIVECLRVAEENRASELFLKANQDITMRMGRELVPMKKAGVPGISMREIVSEILNDEEKKALYENLKVMGQKTIGSVNFRFDFQIDFDGISGALTLGDRKQNPWNFPVIVHENLAKNFGLTLLSGGRRSGKTSALKELLNHLPKKQKVIALYSDDESIDSSCEGNILFSFPLSHLSQNGAHESADLIIFDTKNPEIVLKAIELAEMGYQVVCCLSILTLEMALQRVLDLLDRDNREVAARRLAAVLQMAIGLRVIKNSDEGKTGIFEILINDSRMKALIQSQKINLIYKAMKEGAESSGMRTLNQSLFQLMLKRKIDFRTAFETSEDPEELDSLLKKIGI